MGLKAMLLIDSRTYLPVYQAYKLANGREKTEEVWELAGKYYEKLVASYGDQDPAYRREIDGQLLKGIALYKALKKKHPDDALKKMEDGMTVYAKSRRAKLKKRMKWKFVKWIFVNLYALRWSLFHDPERGYKHGEVKKDSTWIKMRVQVEECPYKACCMKQGVPELLHVFCKYEETCYTGIPGLIFHLSQEKDPDQEEIVKSCDVYMGLYQDNTKEEKKKKKKEERQKKYDKWHKTHYYV